MTPYVVEDVLDVSKGVVEGVKVRHAGTNEISVIPATGVFVAIGHDPNTKPFVGQLKMNAAGYLVTHDGPLTDVEGVFACGDVQDHIYRQAVTAAGSGCMAAIEAERFLENHHA
jgi:thioredoxin reductase (NADPH)